MLTILAVTGLLVGVVAAKKISFKNQLIGRQIYADFHESLFPSRYARIVPTEVINKSSLMVLIRSKAESVIDATHQNRADVFIRVIQERLGPSLNPLFRHACAETERSGLLFRKQNRNSGQGVRVSLFFAKRVTDFLLFLARCRENLLPRGNYNAVHAFNSYRRRVPYIFHDDNTPELRLPVLFKSERPPYAYISGYPRAFGYLQLPVSSFPLVATNVGISAENEQSYNFNEKFPPRKPLAAIIFGFLLVGWGWGWWKGIYDHSYGWRGCILSVFSISSGILLWWFGIDGVLRWWVHL
jgi:hypothetical protein